MQKKMKFLNPLKHNVTKKNYFKLFYINYPFLKLINIYKVKIINSLKEQNLNQDLFPIFFWDEWFEFERANNYNAFLFFDETINAILPFKITKLKFLKKADYLYKPLTLNVNTLDENEEKSVIDRFHEFLKNNCICDVVCPPMHYSLFKAIPDKCLYYKIGLLQIDLLKEEEEIFKSFHKDYRKKIRKSEKIGTYTIFDNNKIHEFHVAYKDSFKFQEKNFNSLNYFNTLKKNLKDNLEIGIVYVNETIEGSLLFIKDKSQAYSLYSGTTNNSIYGSSNKFLMWQTFIHLKRNKVSTFNYGGIRLGNIKDTKIKDISDFKLRFGAEVIEGYHFIKIINPFKYYLFEFLLKMKSFLMRKEYSLINKSGLDIKKS